MSRQAQILSQRDLFNDCDRCNRAILKALEAGLGPGALGELFRQKESLLGRLDALEPLPARSGPDPEEFSRWVEEASQAQAQAIRSETLLYAALQPQIPYNGKRINPYQQPSRPQDKNTLEREG